MLTFADRLRAARKIRNMSQAELCRRADQHQPVMCHYEDGSRKPSLDNLHDIAKALDISADYLLGLVEHPYRLSLNRSDFIAADCLVQTC